MKAKAKVGNHAAIEEDPPLNAAAIAAIHAAVIDAGYKPGNETKKLSAFASPNGQTLYVDKLGSNLNDIRLLVDPRLERGTLARLEEAAIVSSDHRFHSNMRNFPKRLNRGKTPTSYGWQIRIETSEALTRFLARFAAQGL